MVTPEKVCLVTGATAGIGEAVALALANKGATVVGVGRNPQKCARSARMIRVENGVVYCSPLRLVCWMVC